MKNFVGTFLVIFILSFCGAKAQETRGTAQIIDQSTRLPIPFVHVKAKGKESSGTTSDVLGVFSVKVFEKDEVLIFSHVGYKKLELSYQDVLEKASIELTPLVIEIQEFEFTAGENPAIPIVKMAVQNRKLNNPDLLESYRYASYNKVVMTLDGISEDPLEDNSSLKFLDGGHLFMSESSSEVKFKKPGRRNETVLATKLSGIENPMFAAVSTTFQPFSLYTDHIKVLEIPFVNPISDDGLRKYDFYLEDSLMTESGKSYLISFLPKSGKSYHLGKGLVYISSTRYALENFLFKPADDSGQIDFEIQQKNRFDGTHWFPEQMNSIYLFKELDLEGRKGKLINQTFISEVGINDIPATQKISAVDVTYNIQKEPDWTVLRKDSLTTREYLTYDRFDNLDPKTKRILNRGANVLAYLSTGRIPLGVVDLVPRRVLRINEFEGVGLGLGLATNDRISELFRLGGYVRYGFRDRAWKYGGNLEFFLNPEQDTRFQFSYSQDIEEPGRPMLGAAKTFSTPGFFFRNFLARRMDDVERFGVDFSSMPFKGIRYKVFGSVENRFQSLRYATTAPSDSYLREFTASEVGLELQYLGNQSLTRVGNDIIGLNLSYPVVGLRVSKAIPDVLGGNQDFLSSEFRLHHQWSSGNSLNQFMVAAQGVWGNNLPISYLNTGFGILGPQTDRFDLPVAFSGYFQTMRIYEFLSDRSLQVSYAHLTGPLFMKKAKELTFAPQVKFHQNFAIGSLSDPDRFAFVEFETMEKGFWESGVEFTNLIKLNSGFQVQGWGFGVFYRYGPYALPNSGDNLRFTLSLSAGF